MERFMELILGPGNAELESKFSHSRLIRPVTDGTTFCAASGSAAVDEHVRQPIGNGVANMFIRSLAPFFGGVATMSILLVDPQGLQ